MNSSVNHPAHYNEGGVECIDAMDAACTGRIGYDAHYTGQIIKYIWRHGRKSDALEDLRKAQWYLNRLIEKVVNDDD